MGGRVAIPANPARSLPVGCQFGCQKKAEPEGPARGSEKGPALIWAVARGNAGIAELLLAHGAEVNARDEDGTSALGLAVQRKKQDVIDVLKRAGAVE